MEILIKDTQELITETEFRNRHPHTSFPKVLISDVLDSFNAVAIMEGPQATATTLYESSIRTGVEEINGQWFTKYELGPIFTDTDNYTAEEQLAQHKASIDDQYSSNIRTQRNQLLKDTDWTQVLDAPVNKEAYATYRQSLRDVTQQETFPYNIVWPKVE